MIICEFVNPLVEVCISFNWLKIFFTHGDLFFFLSRKRTLTMLNIYPSVLSVIPQNIFFYLFFLHVRIFLTRIPNQYILFNI